MKKNNFIRKQQTKVYNKKAVSRGRMAKGETTLEGVLEFTALVHKEDDTYVAECIEIGTVSQGKTINDAISNLKEATMLYLEGFPLKERRKAVMRTFEVMAAAKA